MPLVLVLAIPAALTCVAVLVSGKVAEAARCGERRLSRSECSTTTSFSAVSPRQRSDPALAIAIQPA